MSDEAKLEEGDINSYEVKYLKMIERTNQRKMTPQNIAQYATSEVSKLQLLQSNQVNLLLYHIYRYAADPCDEIFNHCADDLYNLFGDDSQSCMKFLRQIKTIAKTKLGFEDFIRDIIAIFPRYV